MPFTSLSLTTKFIIGVLIVCAFVAAINLYRAWRAKRTAAKGTNPGEEVVKPKGTNPGEETPGP